MSSLDHTLSDLAPRVTQCRNISGHYNPKHCLAIYYLPIPNYSPTAPVMALGEAIAARNGLGCVVLDGLPKKIPEGAAVIAQYADLKAVRPDLLENMPTLSEPEQYAIRLDRNALVTSRSIEGLIAGIQTLTMLLLRHKDANLPGSVIFDGPICQIRGLAFELASDEINAGLLLQIASFAATFKANRLHLILSSDFDPGIEIPDIDVFVQTCQSYGIGIGVHLPWLSELLSGKRHLLTAWSGIRSAARIFGANQAALDDPCPFDANSSQARKIVDSILNGDVGLKSFSLDAKLIKKSGCPVSELKPRGVTGWHRLEKQSDLPPEFTDIPIRIDVQAPIMGSFNHTAAYHRRLDSVMIWLRSQTRRELIISFRSARTGYLWRNLMHPAATGLISAWGNPLTADQSSWLFAHLLYGDLASSVLDMWESVSAAYPSGLSMDDEQLLRQVAFGRWPEDERTLWLLAGIDWPKTIRNINSAADKLKIISEGLIRNAATLSGANFCLQAVSWLCSFSSLVPELERLRIADSPDFAERGAAMARELMDNFNIWSDCLQKALGESGQETGNEAILGDMRQKLRELCRGMLE